jgi:hypothetical protein
LGVEHIGAYSPQVRGRSERAFQTLQDRLVKELKLAGITSIDKANAFIREVYPPAHSQRFAVAAAEPGSAFTQIPGVDLGEIPCVQEERQVMKDNCVSYRTLKLQIPPSPMRAHFVRGSRSTSAPTDPAPSSTGPAASAVTMRTERSEMRKRRLNPLGGEPRGNVDKASALPTVPQGGTKPKETDF